MNCGDQAIRKSGSGDQGIGLSFKPQNPSKPTNPINSINGPNDTNDPNVLNALNATNATNPMRPAPCPLLAVNEAGQAMVEYLLATIFAALVIGAAFLFFFSALRGYYGLLTFMVGLPIP